MVAVRWALALLLSTSAVAAEPAAVPELTLSEALDRFRADSPTAAQLEARVEQARAAVRLTTASTLPVLAVQGGYVRNNAEVSVSLGGLVDTIGGALPVELELDGLPDDILIQPLEQWSGAATLLVPLVAPTAWADIAAARQGRVVAERQVDAARQQAEAALARGAWMALAAEEVLTARSLAVETAEAHRDAARRRQEAGLSTSLALSAAETEVARRQSEALAAVADLDAARRALGALLGGQAVRIVPTAPTEDGAARNAQVLAAEASVAAASRQVTSAWWRHAPTISGDVRLLASDVPYPTGLKTGWRLGLSLNWVLYDGGARYGLLRKQRAQLEQAEAEASQALVEAARAAADAREALDVAEERLALAEAAAWTAAEGRDASVRLFEAGVASSLDALDAQQRAVDAAVALASARAALGVAKVDLALALGWDQAR